MNKTGYSIIAAMIAIMAVFAFICYREANKDYYNLIVVSGATPLAIAKDVPSNLELSVDGLVKKNYRFSGSALNGFATTRIRTKEISPEGKYLGAYIYLGIPVFHILEGIAPKKPDNAIFKQPLDIEVTFSSSSGKQVHFSYNEILMTDDRFPVTLAFNRKPLQPAAEEVRDSYSLNLFKENLTGLRLICPREQDTARYLDDVTRITYTTLPVPDHLLPARQKGVNCVSTNIHCIDKGNENVQIIPAVFNDIKTQVLKQWIKIGHGKGYRGTDEVFGYDMKTFLKKNFPGCTPSDFFLFVACDGYRCLYSGQEIFNTPDGNAMIIVQSINGSTPKEGFMVASTADYFVDRSLWGLSHIVMIKF